MPQIPSTPVRALTGRQSELAMIYSALARSVANPANNAASGGQNISHHVSLASQKVALLSLFVLFIMDLLDFACSLRVTAACGFIADERGDADGRGRHR